ncbi:hypothetical protein [Thermococcus sp. 5-4]|uniref:hypothetical protein n=1 Tax=Thermococcus sp. 5-4 TaxID=2008440 RepID=UPI000B4A2C40|nr:hypothetical protein [Thermococcus sp. 5-4]ASA77108.1 hypothetical protein CDI07_01960 [Thermococcus sp. 5-4]
MNKIVGKYKTVHYEDVVEEYEVPVRGFLFRDGRLEGVYVKGGILPVTEELPRDVHEDILRGRSNKKLLVREVRYAGAEVLEVYIQDDYRTWPVYVTKLPEGS